MTMSKIHSTVSAAIHDTLSLHAENNGEASVKRAVIAFDESLYGAAEAGGSAGLGTARVFGYLPGFRATGASVGRVISFR